MRFPHFIFISYATLHSFHFTTSKSGDILLMWKNASSLLYFPLFFDISFYCTLQYV